MRGWLGRRWAGRRALAAELLAFGVVGGLAFVVDVGLFNLLRYGGHGLLAGRPVTAKLVSASVATLASWAGNRWWTYRARGPAHQPRAAVARELALFFAMNGLALLISVLALATSHYVLDLRSPLADNLSANVVGVGLGTAFRFVAYRLWVFRPARASRGRREPGQPGQPGGAGAQPPSQASSSHPSKEPVPVRAPGPGSSTSPARSVP